MGKVNADEIVRRWGFLRPGEPKVLEDLARSLPANPVVVNIGAGTGTSGLAFLESREDLTLYTVDKQDTDTPFGGLKNERTILEEAGYLGQARQHQVLGDSKTVGRSWDLGPVDMVFVDGDHSYIGVKEDIEAWLPRVKPGGIIAFHDYHHEQPQLVTVTKAVDEFMVGFEKIVEYALTVAFRVPA